MNKTNEYYENFDWIKYKEYYKDLKNISNKKNAIDHWLKHGKKENRIFFEIKQEFDKNSNTYLDKDKDKKEYDNFHWKIYIENYPDLKEIKSKDEAWNHWIRYGKKEKRVFYSLYKKERDEYLILKEKEKGQQTYFNKNKNLVLKPLYSNYGLHYFGWEGVMNNLLENIQKNNELNNYKFKFEEKVFFDEWIEKLLIWGNKLKNKEFLQEIEENNYKWISFFHNPSFNKYYIMNNIEKEELEKHVLFNEKLLNKNVFDLLDSKYPKIKENLKYFYTLSNSHKKYIYNTYPEYRKKIVSVHHPIYLDTESNKLFNFNEFKESKNIFHIGWWLRNFKTFIDICFPCDFKKNILVKKDFEHEWNYISVDFDLTKIQVIKELNKKEYEKIFRNSCIFCDMEDAVANNVVLECIKFNTPIIVKKIDSVVEYLGDDYPLYFSTQEDLNRIEFSTMDEFLKMISDAHEYLFNKNKKYLDLHTFNKKIFYDLHKLAKIDNPYSLTWFCFIENENQLEMIPSFIEQFKKQTILEKIILKFVIEINFNLKQKVLEIIEKNVNIECIFIKEENSCYHECLNVCLDNTTTEYLTIVNINDEFLTEYSSKHVDYLDNNPNCDIAFSSFKIRTKKNRRDECEEYVENQECVENEEYEEIDNKFEKEEQIFIDDFNNKNLPTRCFVWRKKMHSIVYYFESLEKKDELKPYFYNFLKKCLISHLNICFISDEILFCLYN